MINTTAVRFNNSNRQFHNELRRRVDSYFAERKLSKAGNYTMYIKTIVLFAAYLVPYFLIVLRVFDNKIDWLLLSAIMGFAMAGIGMSIMHDANHGSYSKSVTFNKLLGYFSISLLSGSSINWKIQHNIIHHTYTNVHEHDEDIAPPGILRFEPHAPRKKIHKFQFLYAWFFYSIMTIMWSTSKDFRQLIRYHKKGFLKGRKLWLVRGANTSFMVELLIIIVAKILYFGYMLIPYFLVKEMTFLNWLTGYAVLHAIAGLIMAMVFQLAHVVGENEFPLPTEDGNLENHWAEHQLKTTMNFALGNRLLGWYVGGLNHQVEHHLFPSICHVHYPKIARIVEKTAREFNLPYRTKKTFIGALWSHEVMLWNLGRR